MIRSTEQLKSAFPNPNQKAQIIVSPYQFVTSGDDSLRVRAASAVAGVELEISYRWLDPSGVIQVNARRLVVPGTRLLVETELALGDGYLLNLVVRPVAGTVLAGQVYAAVEVVRGTGAVGVVLGQLLGGYCTATSGLAWPGSPIIGSLEGPGCLRHLFDDVLSPPALYAWTVPAGARWRPVAVLAYALTDATAGTREYMIQLYVDALNFICLVPDGALIPDSRTTYHSWIIGGRAQSASSTTYTAAVLPDEITLLAGGQVYVLSIGYQGPADQFIAVGLTVLEWLEV